MKIKFMVAFTIVCLLASGSWLAFMHLLNGAGWVYATAWAITCIPVLTFLFAGVITNAMEGDQ